MGFWDGGLDDLSAVGVQVTATEERILNEGEGAVMYLNPLMDPMSVFDGGGYGPLVDADGESIYVPWRITVVSPIDSYAPAWKQGEGKKIWQEIDEEQGTEWRKFPAYVGLLVEESAELTSAGYGIEYHWTEMLRPYRFWSCTPIASDQDMRAVVALEKATMKMLTQSCYLDLMWSMGEEHSGEICLEDIAVGFGIVTPPKPEQYSDQQWESVKEEWRQGARDMYGDDDESCMQRAHDYAHLVEKGLYRWSWEDVPPNGWKDLEIGQITDYLEPSEQFAADFWERAIAKKKASMSKVEQTYFREIHQRRAFQYSEGQIA